MLFTGIDLKIWRGLQRVGGDLVQDRRLAALRIDGVWSKTHGSHPGSQDDLVHDCRITSRGPQHDLVQKPLQNHPQNRCIS